jgi:hypothetical protein
MVESFDKRGEGQPPPPPSFGGARLCIDFLLSHQPPRVCSASALLGWNRNGSQSRRRWQSRKRSKGKAKQKSKRSDQKEDFFRGFINLMTKKCKEKQLLLLNYTKHRRGSAPKKADINQPENGLKKPYFNKVVKPFSTRTTQNPSFCIIC